MGAIDDILDKVVAVEGGYVNNPQDRGGPTKYGITLSEAIANGYHGDMRALSREFALEIYKRKYIERPHFDQVAAISVPVAAELIDSYINMGGGNADTHDGPVYWLQRWLNAFNKRGTLYADVVVDGQVGPAVLKALQGYKHTRDENVLVRALNCSQGGRYLSLVEHNPTQEDFAYGWIANRVSEAVAASAPSPARRLGLIAGSDLMPTEPTVTDTGADLAPATAPEVPGLVTWIGGALTSWAKNRLKENSTLLGIALLAITLAMDPYVFQSALDAFRNVTAHKQDIWQALIAVGLVVWRERSHIK